MASDDKKPEVKGPPVPKLIDERLKRGRQAMLKDGPKRRVCHKFWVGEHYWYVTRENRLGVQDTTLVGGAKLPHRIRGTHNYFQSIIEAKVSAATLRVPGYEITPTTGDWEDREAAAQAARVAVFGYDKWGLRLATTKVVTLALVQREGFALPYFDPNVGPFQEVVNLQTGETEMKGRGEIKVRVYSRSEVMWEPGATFEESLWWATEQAMPVDEVENMPGFVGGNVKADANTTDAPTDKDTANSALVTIYYERPCPQYPDGRRMVYANKKQIVDPAKIDPDNKTGYEPYPCLDPDGKVCDEPVLHRLSYTVNPDGEDMGLGERLVDPQRTVNDCWNKEKELKNRGLNLQILVPVGAWPKTFTPMGDTPGLQRFYNPVGNLKPEWEKPPPPELLNALETIRVAAIEEMRALAADVDVQPNPRLASKTAGLAVDTAMQRGESFLGDLAQWHSRLMRHCLSLAQVFYDEPRQVEIQGEHSSYSIQNFSGQDLRSQINVRVSPGSLVQQSKQAIREDLAFINATWPGAMGPEQGVVALQDGVSESILKSYKNHVNRANRIADLCEQGMGGLEALPKRFDPEQPTTDEFGRPVPLMGPDGPVIDPMTGQPVQAMGDDVPGWMPRKQDNVDIWKQVFSDRMTTPRYDQQPSEIQQAFELVWNGLEHLEQRRAQREVMQRADMAAGQGMDNAAAPQVAPPLPDRSMTQPR